MQISYSLLKGDVEYRNTSEAFNVFFESGQTFFYLIKSLFMDLLIRCQDLSKSYSSRTLFELLSLSIFSQDRIGLVGLNGCGKSTLLKIIAGLEPTDSGVVSLKKGIKIGYLPQSCEFESFSPKEILLQALDKHIDLQPYEKELQVDIWLSKLGFTGDEPRADKLSGGWKKRLGLARELLFNPDVLLLDEPTNHLDLEGVLWLEKFLQKEVQTYLVVSHDRYFLQHVTSKIFEIDKIYPRGVFEIEGSYSHFLEKKQQFIEGQLQTEKSVATKARRELEWLRQGVKARTTKSQSRIDDAYDLQALHQDLKSRNTQKKAGISFESSERETRKLLVAKNLQMKIEDRVLFSRLDLLLSPGSRIGLMGKNGSGKTTLLKLLQGIIQPSQGTIKRADDLKIVYFDQHRAELPLDITLKDALSPKGDYVEFRGQKIHVNGWCKRFLFSPDLLEMKIGQLSGGERARIAMAHLMLQKADLLLLDEPTNDLDIPTLEALEESLMEFPGACVLITHDRCMMDRICNTILSLGDSEDVGIYQDLTQWENARQEKKAATLVQVERKSQEKEKKPKLSYSEKKEYDSLEGKINNLELKLQSWTAMLDQEDIQKDPKKLSAVCTEIALVQTLIEQAYIRFDELDRKNK